MRATRQRPGRRRLPPALQSRDFLLLWTALLAQGLGTQMVAVAIGWQVYAISHSPLDLGLIGLAEFVPLLVLALPAGQLADRFPRRLVFAFALALNGAVTALLLVVTLGGASRLWPFLALAAGIGVAMAVANPAARALGPSLVPSEVLPSALALRAVAIQAGMIGGPALGGVLFTVHPLLVYACATGLMAVGVAALTRLREPVEPAGESGGASRLANVLAGIRFIRRTPVMMGAITLDLFAVLLGGQVALLPLFARTILHTGPIGLGVLRSAPALGALAGSVLLTTRPLKRRAGSTLLAVVAAFGVAMVVFGLSHSLPLSLAALAVGGFVDTFSVNIRSTIAVVAPPNEVRGRVVAVESVFISASNELGAFESGAAAALLGAVPAVVAGGVLTVALAATWRWIFPDLARVDRLEDLRPGPRGVPGSPV